MPWIAQLVGGIASAAGGALNATAASRAADAAGRRSPTQRVPLPQYADALNRYTARLIAANATTTPPSFGDFLASGGRATFPLTQTGFTPAEAARLRLVDPRTGGPIPMYDEDVQSRLTPEQILYLGQQRLRERGAEAQGPIARYARVTGKLERIAERPSTPRRERRTERLERRKSRLEEILGLTGEE